MNHFRGQIVLGLMLILVSIVLYAVQIAIYHDAHTTFFYLLQDMAFIPIQVLLVTLILNTLLNIREKTAMLNKMNMVIGTFFSEVGSSLLKSFVVLDKNSDALRRELLVSMEWTDSSFDGAIQRVNAIDHQIRHADGDLVALKELLLAKRSFLLSLLENPNLLEHEKFTDLLWAVFHLTEELAVRKNVQQLTPADANHIALDIKRAYALLITEWLAYLRHLKRDYPYLFSFAVRTNPFDPNASVIIKSS
jgi:hypothetical protein